MGYRIKSPSVDWAGDEIAIEMHCDAGKILTKMGSRAQIGICVFEETNYGVGEPKMLSFDMVFLYRG